MILIVATLQNYAQEFAPVGAIWHYTQRTINPDLTSFKTIEAISDTSINGIQCRKMIEVERYIDTTNVMYHYMYSENDSVFFFAENDFHLLYDFGANTGDTIILDYFSTYNGTPLKMIIDSTGTIIVNNQEKEIQYITCGDGIVIEFGNHVIAGIGNTSFMFPTLDGSINGPLRCYQDNSTDLFLNPFHPTYGWNHQDCEEIITSIEEAEKGSRITVYPNPSTNNISITNVNQPIEFRILDINGKLIEKGVLQVSSEIRIKELPNGIYFIELQNENIRIIRKIIKK